MTDTTPGEPASTQANNNTIINDMAFFGLEIERLSKENRMGTYAHCLQVVAHNTEAFVNSFMARLDDRARSAWVGFNLCNKIDLIQGNRVSRVRIPALISDEFGDFLHDLRKGRNESVHVPGFLYELVDSIPIAALVIGDTALVIRPDASLSGKFTSTLFKGALIDPPPTNAKSLSWEKQSESPPPVMEKCDESNAVVCLSLWTIATFKANFKSEQLTDADYPKTYGVLRMVIGKNVCVYPVSSELYRKLHEKDVFVRANPATIYFRFSDVFLFNYIRDHAMPL